MADYEVDPMRLDRARDEIHPTTGILVRAKEPGGGGYESYDITYLTKDSLLRWLRSRGGDNPWAEQTVCIILGHS